MKNPATIDTSKRLWYWSIGIGVVGLMIILAVYDDYGITWDESVQSRYGELVLDYFTSGFSDTRCNDYLNLRFYGPLFELIAAILYHPFPELKFEIRHFCIAVTALLSVIGVIKYAGLFADPLMPVFSSLGLCMLPGFVGHAFNNSKDMPFACAFIWAMYAQSQLATRRKPQYRQTIFCGVMTGLALAIRMGGVLLLVYLFFNLLYDWIWRVIALKQDKILCLKQNFISLLSIIFTSWMVAIIFWPWAHQNIIVHPWKALQLTTEFTSSYHLLYEGRTISSMDLPWHYLPKYLTITTPTTLLALAVIGVWASARTVFFALSSLKIRSQNESTQHQESRILTSTLLWLSFPIVYFCWARPNVYDGIRHFLFIQPALAVLAGYGATTILRHFDKRLNRKLLMGCLLILILSPLHALIALHPYQSAYFNAFVGGVEKASQSYETDYWLSSYKEAAEWINQRKKQLHKERIRVLLAANNNARICFDYYVEEGIECQTIFSQSNEDKLPEPYDYYVATTRYGLDRNFPKANIVQIIGRQNAHFTVIKGK